MHHKYAFLIIFMIAGALIVSYGFHRIQSQQDSQNKLTRELHSLIVQERVNTQGSLTRQRASDLVLCNAINKFRPPPPQLNCVAINEEALQAARAEGG